MGLIYLDSCLAIYSVERHATYGPLVDDALAALPADERLVSSPLALLECLVKPIRIGARPIEARYRRFFAALAMLELDEAVFERAAHLRAQTPSLKTPDAIHLAAAQRHGCEALWTNDDRFAAAADGYVVNVLAPRGRRGRRTRSAESAGY